MRSERRVRFARFAFREILVPLLTCIASCRAGNEGPNTGSETHFLIPCEQSCSGAAECICGVCTTPCSETATCAALESSATCATAAARISQGRCGAGTPAAFCDVLCLSDGDCSLLGDGYLCQEGYCRAGSAAAPPADSGPTSTCAPSGLKADQIMVFGDSIIELTSFTTQFEQQAMDAAILLQGEKVRLHASSTNSRLAAGASSLMIGYETARQEGPARLVVMDGGETDMFTGLCGTEPASSCPNVQAAADGATQLMAKMAEDGVEHILYFFYPDPIGNPSLKAALDVLRPLVRNVCGNSPVPCEWLDLRPLFANHPEYLGPDGMLLSDEGARVAAAATWDRLRQRCIAW